MRRLLLTGWCGTEHGAMAAHTTPLMERYAHRHGANFGCANLQHREVPASWVKVPLLIGGLKNYDEVCWIDADVVIARSDVSIFDAVAPDAWQSMVEHKTECGEVPNCGIWVVRRPMVPVLAEIWNDGLPKYKTHPWWEQVATMERMGYSIYGVNGNGESHRIAETPLFERTCLLPAEWNDHPRDERRSPDPRFIHVTQYDDRVGSIRRLCAQAT